MTTTATIGSRMCVMMMTITMPIMITMPKPMPKMTTTAAAAAAATTTTTLADLLGITQWQMLPPASAAETETTSPSTPLRRGEVLKCDTL